MAFVDVSVSMSDVSASKVVVMADRFVNFARHSVARGEDDLFTAKRLRAERLPSIQSCQSSIFRELRHREEEQSKTHADFRDGTSEPRGIKLKARLGKLFAKH